MTLLFVKPWFKHGLFKDAIRNVEIQPKESSFRNLKRFTAFRRGTLELSE